MTSEEALQAHIRQGHRPYRRGCRTRVLEMGARSPHRRRRDATTSSWAMSVVGPFPRVIRERCGEVRHGGHRIGDGACMTI